MIYITRKESFSAAHKLFREDWTQEKNSEVFGPCANPNWHGHNYDLIVTLKGEPDPETGFVINLRTVSEIIQKEVIEKIDHKNINLDVSFMKGKLATTEILTIEIWKQLEKPLKIKGGILHSIRLQETNKNYVEYFGPGN